MAPPAATGLGDPLSVTPRSALEITVATLVATSFVRLISLPPLTIAVFVKVDGADWETLAAIAIDGSLLPLPARLSDRTQRTVCDATPPVHPVPVPPVGTSPVGSVSFTVTTPFVAP